VSPPCASYPDRPGRPRPVLDRERGGGPLVSSTLHSRTLASTRLLLETYAGRRLPDWERFTGSTDIVTVERGAVVAPARVQHPYVYLVIRGLLKVRVRDGRADRTLAIHGENELATSWPGLGMELFARVDGRTMPHLRADDRARPTGSPFELVAIEPTTAMRASFTTLEALAERHHGWSLVLSTLIGTNLVRTVAALPDAHLSTPEERYRDFLERRPDLVERISQRELAAHLGVTEVGMSRIVRRVAAQRAERGPST